MQNFIHNDVINRAYQSLTGSIVLVINPFKNIHSGQTLDAYGFTSELIELPPHVWSVARDAYTELILNSTLQQQVTSLLSCQLVLCCFYLFNFFLLRRLSLAVKVEVFQSLLNVLQIILVNGSLLKLVKQKPQRGVCSISHIKILFRTVARRSRQSK